MFARKNNPVSISTFRSLKTFRSSKTTKSNVFEWSHIKQDLKALQETHIEEGGNRLAVRSKAEGVCGKVFQAVGVAMPPTIREIKFAIAANLA